MADGSIALLQAQLVAVLLGGKFFIFYFNLEFRVYCIMYKLVGGPPKYRKFHWS